MLPSTKEMNGIILAGGKSSRMGQDKGLMEVDGQPMVRRVIDVLSPLVNKVLIIANDPAYSRFGYPVYPDLIPGKGPAGGIYTGLTHTGTEKNICLSCDLIRINEGLLRFLIRESKDSEITVAKHGQKTEPLIGIYRKKCLSGWKKLLEQDLLKLQDMIEHFEVNKVAITPDMDFYHDHLFDNINAPEDLNKHLWK